MPSYNSKQFIQNLEDRVQAGIVHTSSLKELSIEHLNTKPKNGGWSITETLAHLNFYANFYTQSLQNAMIKSQYQQVDKFSTGWLGDYFTNIIGPAAVNEELKKKMNSPINARPSSIDSLDPLLELSLYLGYQQQLLDLLQVAKCKNLQKTRVATSLSPLLKLRLGDTFNFVIAHQERHGQQIDRLR